MKKYWKIITLSAIIVLSIGTFYLHSAVSAMTLPQFEIKKQSGNETLVHTVVINGQYLLGSKNRSVTITTKGSTYDDQLFGTVRLGNHGPIIKQLIKNHRHFMRGKALNVSYYFENQKEIAYAIIDYTNTLRRRKPLLSISVLNKKGGRSQSFKVPIPNSAIYKYIAVQDVQWIKGTMKICTINERSSTAEEEVHVYTIKKKQLISDRTILSVPSKVKGGFASIGFSEETNPTQSHKYEILERQDEIQKSGKQNTVERHTLFAYNLKTDVTNKIPKSRKFIDIANPMPTQEISGSTLYLRSPDEKNVTLTPYDLSNGSFGQSVRIPFPSDETSRPPEVKIHHHDVYVMFYVKGKPAAMMTVTDLQSGKVLYKGKVTETNMQANQSNDHLILSGFKFGN